MKNIKSIIQEFESYTKRKSSEYQRMTTILDNAFDQLQQDAYTKYSEQLHAQFNAHFKLEFQALGEKLNRELDCIKSDIYSRIKAKRPADYELKLSNTMKMIESLDGREISGCMDDMTKMLKPFSYDPMARNTISKLLSDKGVFPVGVFDDTT